MNNKELSILRGIIDQNARLKECFMSDCDDQCSTNIINAHSLQRMGSLSIIESVVNKNNSIYTITDYQENETSNLLELIPVGKQKASTFYGFCGKHDSNIFKPIEDNPDKIDINSDEHCFLLSFRAFALSYHRKKECVNLYSTDNKCLKEKIKIHMGTEDLEGLLEGSKLGLNDIKPYKELLINSLMNRDYSFLDYFTYELDYTVPIAACMLTSPPFLFSGKPINISNDPNYVYSDIMTSVIPLKKRTIIIMAAFGDTPHGAKYLNELSEMTELNLQKALTWHILTDMENFFLSPKWFDKFDPKEKHDIISFCLHSGNVETPFLRFSHNFPYNFFEKRHSL